MGQAHFAAHALCERHGELLVAEARRELPDDLLILPHKVSLRPDVDVSQRPPRLRLSRTVLFAQDDYSAASAYTLRPLELADLLRRFPDVAAALPRGRSRR